MNLQPQNNFTVVRQISNHLDTNTYYVQAVIRNAYTDVIIDTLNLDSKGSQRYTKNWQVPADPSGQGFYISIVTSVYTDSGHTTKSDNYGDEVETYLVQDRILVGRLGGQSGTDVDYEKVRKIVEEVVVGILKTEKESDTEDEEKPLDLSPILGAVDNLQKAVAGINIPDVSPKIEELKALVEKKDKSYAQEMENVVSKLENEMGSISTEVGKFKTILETSENIISNNVETSINKLKDAIRNTTLSIAPTKAIMNLEESDFKEPKFDISSLAK